MKKYISKASFTIAVMVLINAMLIFKILRSSEELSILKEKIQINEFSAGYNISHEFKNLNFIKPFKDNLNLVVIISEMGCKSCIDNYLKNVNYLSKNNSVNVKVYYIGINKEQLRNNGAEFDYEHIKASPEYSSLIKTTQPIAVLCDKDKNVLLSNMAEVMDKSGANSFFASVEYLFRKPQKKPAI